MKELVLILLFIAFLPSHSLAGDDLVSALGVKLKHLNQRQSVISQNIANSDTPGYKALDLADINFQSVGGGMGVQLQATSPNHISDANSATKFKYLEQKNSGITTLDGNNVNLEEQMLKMAQTDMEYNKTVGLMRQINGLVRTAIGRQQ